MTPEGGWFCLLLPSVIRDGWIVLGTCYKTTRKMKNCEEKASKKLGIFGICPVF
jgi:hypothetical protein